MTSTLSFTLSARPIEALNRPSSRPADPDIRTAEQRVHIYIPRMPHPFMNK